MKEIKSYVRCEKASEVVHALEEAGVPGFTVTVVKGMGGAADREREKWSIEYVEKTCKVVKIELVCNDEDAERLVGVIKEKAYTGHSGDGMIFVTQVARAVKIKSGEEGTAALRP